MPTSNPIVSKSEKDELVEALDNLLVNSQEPVAISLKGSWGIGKSFFWDEYSKRLNKKKYAYVSLFGKNSLDEVKEEIVLQISSIYKGLEKIRKVAGSTKIMGVDISSGIAAIPHGSFNEVIICFDDMERISKSLDIKDVMGLMSELKERKKCKIVIINNSDQLKEHDELNDKEIHEHNGDEYNKKYKITSAINQNSFRLFFEKIIDYSFIYSPSIQENFDLLKDQIKFFDPDEVLNFLIGTNDPKSSLKNNYNLRMMKQLINRLNMFSFLEEKEVERTVINDLLTQIFFSVYKTKIDRIGFYGTDSSPIQGIVENAIEKSFVMDKSEMLEAIDILNNRARTSDLNEQCNKIYFKYRYDLSFDSSAFAEELLGLIEANKKLAVVAIGHESLRFYINTMSEVMPANAAKYDELYKEVLRHWVDGLDKDNLLFMEGHRDPFTDAELPLPQEIVDYMAQIKSNKAIDMYRNLDSVKSILEKPVKAGGWSRKEQEIAASIPVDLHKKYITESMDYFTSAYSLIKWSNNFSGDKPYDVTCRNIAKAIRTLHDEAEDKVRLSFFIEYLDKCYGSE